MESPPGLLGDCLASWPHAGKKRRKQSGPSEQLVPAECEAQQPPAPHSTQGT